MSTVSRCLAVIPLLTLLLTGGASAFEDDLDVAGISGIQEKVSIGGYGFWQFGQIMDGYNYQLGQTFSHQWQNNVLIGLSIIAHPSEHFSILLNPEFFLNYPFPQLKNFPKSVRPFGIAYINEARGMYSFGDSEKPFLQLSVGMFTFKYNQDVRNLGEYLFRTGTYPTYIINEFDFPAARLLGLHAGIDPLPDLHADILVTSEAFMFPLYDFSVSGLLSYKLLKAIEIGGGIDFARCFPVDDKRTSPELRSSESGGFNQYIKESGDTGFYSFKATKVMARATVDIKALFSSPKIFGPEDLKLYGEVCWVGVGGYHAKEVYDSSTSILYHPWYNDLNERTPRMFGLNWPTHPLMSYTVVPGVASFLIDKNIAPRIIGTGAGLLSGVGLWLLEKKFGVKTGLDLLSVEVEYFPSVIPNDYRNVIYNQTPVPYLTTTIPDYKESTYNKGFWRWSVYAKKMISNGFSITAAAAFDHLRTTDMDGFAYDGEYMTKAGNWHWKLKFGYSF